jgi:hypothetical protein
MEITEFALRLMLLFFPGIICFYIVETLTVHRERPTHEVLLRCFVYGVFSYVAYMGVLGWLNTWWEEPPGYGYREQISLTQSITDEKFHLDFAEIGFVTAVAVGLGLSFSFAIAHKWPNDFAQWTRISRKFGDANVWSRTFNAKEAKWATVRDIERNLMFSGYVLAFSDVEEVAELLLTQVVVYNETTGKELYRADNIYLSRPKDCLTVEIPNPPSDKPRSDSSTESGGAQSTGEPPQDQNPPAQPPKRRRRRK